MNNNGEVGGGAAKVAQLSLGHTAKNRLILVLTLSTPLGSSEVGGRGTWRTELNSDVDGRWCMVGTLSNNR